MFCSPVYNKPLSCRKNVAISRGLLCAYAFWIKSVFGRTELATGEIEKQMPITPREALGIWVRDRLSATGSGGILQVQVLEASVVDDPLDTETGFIGWFKNEQAKRLTASLKVRFSYASAGRTRQAYADTIVQKSLTFAEKMSLEEREQAEFSLVEGLLQEFDVKAAQALTKHMPFALN